jgi:NAD(P)-dependent dehydrogenase (short-subunit alcohol dehydrogenase family)
MNGHNGATPAGPGQRADLSGQVALITGGGRGIGRVFAQTLAAAGAKVAVAARSEDELARTVALVEEAGGQALALPLDVTDRRAVEQVVNSVERLLGPPALLVNNAGVSGPFNTMWEVDPDEWWRAMDINLRGSFLCARAVLAGMIERRYGRIINIASHAGVYRWPQVSAYSVSKAALVKLTENLAVETKRLGVAVFAVHPGIVTIGLTEAALAISAAPDTPIGRATGWVRQQVEAGNAVPPERSAELVLRLAAGLADALSGRYLTVFDDLDTLIAQAAEIQRDDLYTLRVRKPATSRLDLAQPVDSRVALDSASPSAGSYLNGAISLGQRRSRVPNS